MSFSFQRALAGLNRSASAKSVNGSVKHPGGSSISTLKRPQMMLANPYGKPMAALNDSPVVRGAGLQANDCIFSRAGLDGNRGIL